MISKDIVEKLTPSIIIPYYRFSAPQLPECPLKSRMAKAGKFGHQVNSDTRLQTVEVQMRRLLMSRLIKISLFA